ncbi:hypothetical protein [Streptomyces sp. CA-251247]|uniref:hypothetical protein n=1 Tax=Streptomyces sp. CA-251247 TaxID=3240062 RepID=UPI003D901F0E
MNKNAAHTRRRGDETDRQRPTEPVQRDQTFTAIVAYHGEPETIEDDAGATEGWLETDDGAVSLGEPTGSMAWFPGNHQPSDKAAYDITTRSRTA